METRTVLAERVELEIVIKFDVGKGIVSVSGCDANPVVALGMLDYALARVRRGIAMNDMRQDVENAPRVSLASQVPQ